MHGLGYEREILREKCESLLIAVHGIVQRTSYVEAKIDYTHHNSKCREKRLND